ncbi:MAG TPA: hypothetical protein VFR36_05230 [Sphingomicrobium sp.]|nr:hypothetical protein [Sphingomicrobium sp.]
MVLIPTKLGATAALAVLLAGSALATDVTMEFDADDFTTPLVIDNPYWPQVPGAEFLYKAETPDGCEWSHVRVAPNGPGEFPTKLITIGTDELTVRTVADFEYEDEDCGGPVPEELVEKTFDWYGQDDFGNVWYFGEDTQNCDGADDCEPGGGAWQAGVDGALPGIIMLGDPDSGERYRQEFAEGVAEDWAKVMNTNNHPVLRDEDALEPGEWDDCLVTKEWNDLEGGSVEQKTYCPDADGLVLVEEHGGKLVRFELVDPGAVDASANAFTFRKVPGNR